MDEHREFLRLIMMEGLGGDDAALEQYRRLIDLWENALAVVLGRYAEKGDVPKDAVPALARQIIYTILMAFEDNLLGRHTTPSASPQQRRDSLAEFVSAALERVLKGAPQPVR
jgi:hypothetical protein